MPLPQPAADKRLRILDAAIRKQQARPDALIELLHKAQDLYGYLDIPLLWHIARSLMLPPSRVYGVATFYHLFRLKPQGKHTCVVCQGTACFVKGADRLLEAANRAIHIVPGETTKSGAVSLLTARCVGACGVAPVAVLDGETLGPLTPEDLATRLERWETDGPG